ncbi:MAG: DUF2737 family protein [Enterobacteriaceae bacterium]|nr:DUF2737 family protein [Enterobacteriaceae bacterium]
MRGNDYNPDLHPNDLCIRQRSRPYPGRDELIRRNSFASVNENKYLTMILRAKK